MIKLDCQITSQLTDSILHWRCDHQILFLVGSFGSQRDIMSQRGCFTFVFWTIIELEKILYQKLLIFLSLAMASPVFLDNDHFTLIVHFNYYIYACMTHIRNSIKRNSVSNLGITSISNSHILYRSQSTILGSISRISYSCQMSCLNNFSIYTNSPYRTRQSYPLMDSFSQVQKQGLADHMMNWKYVNKFINPPLDNEPWYR